MDNIKGYISDISHSNKRYNFFVHTNSGEEKWCLASIKLSEHISLKKDKKVSLFGRWILDRSNRSKVYFAVENID